MVAAPQTWGRSTEHVPEEPLLPTLTELFRFSKQQYYSLAEKEILTPEQAEGVELIDGLLVVKAMKSTDHNVACNLLQDEFRACLPKGWYIETTGSADMDESQPEPDGMIYQGNARTFKKHHAEPADLAIVIEVSKVTLRTDRREKGWKYAQNNIPAYWIINLNNDVIEVYTDPQPFLPTAKYASKSVYARGEAVPVVLGGQAVATIAVDALLP